MIKIKNWQGTGVKKPFKDIKPGDTFIFTDDIDRWDNFEIWHACEFSIGYVAFSCGEYSIGWGVDTVSPEDECELVSATIIYDNT